MLLLGPALVGLALGWWLLGWIPDHMARRVIGGCVLLLVVLQVSRSWWPEAFDGTNGWAIGDGVERPTPEEQDAADVESLYLLLEQQIVPEFYARDDGQVPHAWVSRMRRSLETCAHQFHTNRMVAEYTRKYYLG